jgi:protein gp37
VLFRSEDRPELAPLRANLFRVIEATPFLTYQLLTKRPETMVRLAADAGWTGTWPRNVWAGCTVENQKYADKRVPELLRVPAAVRFLSCEPLLGPVDLTAIKRTLADGFMRPLDGRFNTIGWIIIGSESGNGARPMDLSWASSLVHQGALANVPVFTKQIANAKDKKGEDPAHWPPGVWPRQFPEVTK